MLPNVTYVYLNFSHLTNFGFCSSLMTDKCWRFRKIYDSIECLKYSNKNHIVYGWASPNFRLESSIFPKRFISKLTALLSYQRPKVTLNVQILSDKKMAPLIWSHWLKSGSSKDIENQELQILSLSSPRYRFKGNNKQS